MSARAVPEWIASSSDAEIPKRVKLRIWEREGGRCYLTGRKIMVGDSYEFEHVIALSCGGEHRESNIRLALTAAHKVKTKSDMATKSKIARTRAKHLGIYPKSKTPLKSRGFSKTRDWKEAVRD